MNTVIVLHSLWDIHQTVYQLDHDHAAQIKDTSLPDTRCTKISTRSVLFHYL